jgi:hypothetical protein
MLGADIIRDLNIKETFIAVDGIENYPIDLIKITIKCEFEDCDFKEITKAQFTDLIENFVSIIKQSLKGKIRDVSYLGVSSEYRIDSYWATPIVIFKFFMIGKNIMEYSGNVMRESNQLTRIVGGDASVTSETIHDREKLFFELYPHTMLDEVMNLLMNIEKQNFYPEELLELMMSPIRIKPPFEFVEYFLK